MLCSQELQAGHTDPAAAWGRGEMCPDSMETQIDADPPSPAWGDGGFLSNAPAWPILGSLDPSPVGDQLCSAGYSLVPCQERTLHGDSCVTHCLPCFGKHTVQHNSGMSRPSTLRGWGRSSLSLRPGRGQPTWFLLPLERRLLQPHSILSLLLTDAVHLRPAGPAPAHPQDLPQQPHQHVCGPEHHGLERLHSEKALLSPAAGLWDLGTTSAGRVGKWCQPRHPAKVLNRPRPTGQCHMALGGLVSICPLTQSPCRVLVSPGALVAQISAFCWNFLNQLLQLTAVS